VQEEERRRGAVVTSLRRSESSLRVAALLLLIGWPLWAFGGAHASTAVAAGFVCILCWLLFQPSLRGPLDIALLVLVAALAVQLVPLPVAVVRALSPHALDSRTRLVLGHEAHPHFGLLTIRPTETEWALMVVVGTIALFWIARTCFARSGLRRTIRGVATMGLGISALALAQFATSDSRTYWIFPTSPEGVRPFGPFTNRYHFATWLMMATSVCIGYLVARRGMEGATRVLRHDRRRQAVHLVDPRGAWLWLAVGGMLVALSLTLSLTGALALVLSVALTGALIRYTRVRGRLLAAAVCALLAVTVVAAWTQVPVLADRPSTRPASAGVHRTTIWREAMPVMRDFWATGSGAGTFGSAMLLYQRSDRSVHFNQARNHFVQMVTEGGLLLLIPAAIVLIVFGRTAIDAVRTDQSEVRHIRLGAAYGLLAAAVQSMWETGLAMPANAALAATLAAVVVHERDPDRRP
jgi:hypothetical protein